MQQRDSATGYRRWQMNSVAPIGWRTVSLLDCVIGKPEYGANAPAIDFDPDLPRYLRITDIRDDGTLSDEEPKSLGWETAQGNLLERDDLRSEERRGGKKGKFRGAP